MIKRAFVSAVRNAPDALLHLRTAASCLGVLALFAACGERQPTGPNEAAVIPPQQPPVYSINGTVSGLAGTGLVLHLSTGEDLAVHANGPVSFETRLAAGTAYSVTIQQLPSAPAQRCIASGAATVRNSAVTDVAVICFATDPALKGQILFTTSPDSGPDIVMLDFERLVTTRLTSGPARDRTPQWSPDRSRIAFVRSESAFSHWGLWVMRPDGSHAERIVEGSGLGMTFTWSPDGSRIAFFDGRSFGITMADGSGLVSLVPALVGPYLYGSPSWAPDGSTIAFFGDPPDSGLDWFFQLLIMNADGSNVRRLTSIATYDGNIDPAERDPAWSPDGTKLACWSAALGLTVMNQDGTSARSVSSDSYRNPGDFTRVSVPPEAAPDWSPDGTLLVYQSERQLFVTKADGTGRPVQITNLAAGAFDPAWVK